MNFGRVAAAALVGWVVYLGLSPLVNNVLLADLYAQHASVFRPREDMQVALGLGAALLGFFVFAYAYAKGYEGGPGLVEGLRFGVIVGLLLACFSGVWSYVMMPVAGSFAAAMVVDAIVEMAVFGIVVGLIYKPSARRK